MTTSLFSADRETVGISSVSTARRLQNRAGRIAVIAWLIGIVPGLAQADFREAAQKLVRATVAVSRVETVRTVTEKGGTMPPSVTASVPPNVVYVTPSSGLSSNQVVVAPNSNGPTVSQQQATQTFSFYIGQADTRITTVQSSNRINAVNLWCGVLISDEGWVVTTAGADTQGKLEVRLTDGRVFPARLVIDDRRTGLWLLKVEIKGARPFVSLGSSPVELGQDVVAAMLDGLESRQIARGVVTALGRHVDGIIPKVFRCDLPAREAAAGAPVANATGELVGILSGIRGDANQAIVIPIEDVNRLWESRQTGGVLTMTPGIVGLTLTATGPGLTVDRVTPSLPAEIAGLKKGDVVLSIDGRDCHSFEEVIEYVGMKPVGATVSLKYRRGAKEATAELRVAARPTPDKSATATDVVQPSVAGRFSPRVNPLGLGSYDAEMIVSPAGVLRVEKTDVEKRIEELRSDVGSLTHGIDSLRANLDKFGKELKDLTETLRKK